MKRGNLWMVILAGDGRKPRRSTHGDPSGEPSSLARVLRVTSDLVPPARTVIIAETERAAAARLPATAPPESLVLLPGGRGTGVYLLTALFSILPHDPRARLVVLHRADDLAPEELLLPAIQEALLALSRMPERLVLVGSRPTATYDPDGGWIIPSRESLGCRGGAVSAFVEKPDYKMARQLLTGGALASVGVFAVQGRRLLDLYAALAPRLVREFVRWQGEDTAANFAAHIQTLPCCDFNSEVLEWAHGSLAVVPLPGLTELRPQAPAPRGAAAERPSPRLWRTAAPTGDM